MTGPDGPERVFAVELVVIGATEEPRKAVLITAAIAQGRNLCFTPAWFSKWATPA